MHSWCLSCSGLNSEHTGERLKEAFEEEIQKEWKWDISRMAGITMDNVSNNQKGLQRSLHMDPLFRS